MINSNNNQVEDLKTYKTYKVKVCSEVLFYTEVEATSEDEAHFQVFDELKSLEERYDYYSYEMFFNRHKDNIINVEPMNYDVMGVLDLPQCKDYDEDTEDCRKPSEIEECA
jgi:hypothetical protein